MVSSLYAMEILLWCSRFVVSTCYVLPDVMWCEVVQTVVWLVDSWLCLLSQHPTWYDVMLCRQLCYWLIQFLWRGFESVALRVPTTLKLMCDGDLPVMFQVCCLNMLDATWCNVIWDCASSCVIGSFFALFVGSACNMIWCAVVQAIVLLVDSIFVTRLPISCFCGSNNLARSNHDVYSRKALTNFKDDLEIRL